MKGLYSYLRDGKFANNFLFRKNSFKREIYRSRNQKGKRGGQWPT